MNGYKVLKGQLRHNGVRYDAGDVINAALMDANECEKLISRGVVSPVVLNKEIVVDVVEKTSLIVPPGDDEPIEVTLDLNFELDELKAGAKEQGLEWKGNISKSNLIKLIVEAEKQYYLLDQLDEGDEDNAVV